MAELKPCPFCGKPAEFVVLNHENSDTTHWHKVMCTDPFRCGAELGAAISFYQPDYKEEVESLKARWNRRAKHGGAE